MDTDFNSLVEHCRTRSRRVLILLPDKHLGNLLLALPAIRSLVDFFRDRTVTVVVDSPFSDIIRLACPLDRVLFYPRSQMESANPLHRARLYLKFLWHLRRAAPDLVIDLKGANTTAVMAVASGARWRVAPHTSKKTSWFTHIAPPSGRAHFFNSYLDIAAATGAPAPDDQKQIAVPPPDTDPARKVLRGAGLNPDLPLVCIHAGAGKDYKIWPSAHFATAADQLASEGCQIAYVGSVKERRKITEILSLSRQPAADLSGKFTLEQLRGLFRISSLFIGSDSGPMHLAALAGTPIVALYGPSDDTVWHPLSDRSVVLRGPERCDFCPCQGNCPDQFKCLTSLTPEMVAQAALNLLSNAGDRPDTSPGASRPIAT